jgi:hypothetical protein
MKERIGLNRKAIYRHAIKAFELGFTENNFKGKAKKIIRFFKSKYNTGNNIKVYGNFFFIFEENILITVIPINKNYQIYFKICKLENKFE